MASIRTSKGDFAGMTVKCEWKNAKGQCMLTSRRIPCAVVDLRSCALKRQKRMLCVLAYANSLCNNQCDACPVEIEECKGEG